MLFQGNTVENSGKGNPETGFKSPPEQFAKVLLLSKHFFQFDNQPWQKRRRHFLFGSEPLDWILAIQLECEPREFTRYGVDDPKFVHSQSGISSLLVFQIKRARLWR